MNQRDIIEELAYITWRECEDNTTNDSKGNNFSDKIYALIQKSRRILNPYCKNPKISDERSYRGGKSRVTGLPERGNSGDKT